jgi:hypothetical protein
MITVLIIIMINITNLLNNISNNRMVDNNIIELERNLITIVKLKIRVIIIG